MLRRELHNLRPAAGLRTPDYRRAGTDMGAHHRHRRHPQRHHRANYDQPTSPDFVLCCDCLYQPAHYASLAATIVRLGAERTLIS